MEYGVASVRDRELFHWKYVRYKFYFILKINYF